LDETKERQKRNRKAELDMRMRTRLREFRVQHDDQDDADMQCLD